MWPGRTRWSYPANTWKSWSPSTDPTPSVHRDDGCEVSQQATTVLACALMRSLVAYVARPASLRGTARRIRDAGTPAGPSLRRPEAARRHGLLLADCRYRRTAASGQVSSPRVSYPP